MPCRGGGDSGDDGYSGQKPEPTSAAGVPAGNNGTQETAEEKQDGTQKAAAHECSAVASDEGHRGSKPVMIAGSGTPAKPSHFINLEYDPTVRNRISRAINSLIGSGDWEAVCEYVEKLAACGGANEGKEWKGN